MPELLSHLLRTWIDLRPIRRGPRAETRPKVGDEAEILTLVYHDCWNGAKGKITMDLGAEGVLIAVPVGQSFTLVAVVEEGAWESSIAHSTADLSVCGKVIPCTPR